jgi:hypothetical protein
VWLEQSGGEGNVLGGGLSMESLGGPSGHREDMQPQCMCNVNVCLYD